MENKAKFEVRSQGEAERLVWTRPEVSRVEAGSAEATFTVQNDGGFSYS